MMDLLYLVAVGGSVRCGGFVVFCCCRWGRSCVLDVFFLVAAVGWSDVVRLLCLVAAKGPL